jgi:hypothetical protein
VAFDLIFAGLLLLSEQSSGNKQQDEDQRRKRGERQARDMETAHKALRAE